MYMQRLKLASNGIKHRGKFRLRKRYRGKFQLNLNALERMFDMPAARCYYLVNDPALAIAAAAVETRPTRSENDCETRPRPFAFHFQLVGFLVYG